MKNSLGRASLNEIDDEEKLEAVNQKSNSHCHRTEALLEK